MSSEQDPHMTDEHDQPEQERHQYHATDLDLSGEADDGTGRSAAWTCTSASAACPSSTG